VQGSGYPKHPIRCVDLIVYISVELVVLSTLGREFPWPRLPRCPACGSARPWGHGYAQRFFDELGEAVWVKRWRCPACGAVHTMRPCSYWRGFWATRALVLQSLQAKVKGRPWLPTVSRQRQQYWWKGFAQQAARQRLQAPSPAVLRKLFRQRIMLATHSLKYREVRSLRYLPHRIFAVTPALEAG
jgi:hypothetical protein